jgi:CheY-like chemotaxis protein
MKALRVLVVEDDALIAMLLSELLAGMGHAVCATAGTEAEAIMAATRYRPDLMIVDAGLGRGSGVSAVEEILCAGPLAHLHHRMQADLVVDLDQLVLEVGVLFTMIGVFIICLNDLRKRLLRNAVFVSYILGTGRSHRSGRSLQCKVAHGDEPLLCEIEIELRIALATAGGLRARCGDMVLIENSSGRWEEMRCFTLGAS